MPEVLGLIPVTRKWYCMPLIPELRRWTQEDQKFKLILKLKVNLGCMRPEPQKKEAMHLPRLMVPPEEWTPANNLE